MNFFGYVIVIGMPLVGLVTFGLPGFFVGLLLAWLFCDQGGF